MATHEERVRLDIRQEFENTLEQRVQRFLEIAHQGVIDLAMVERELFEVAFDNGRILPKQPKYWDLRPDGTAAVYLRDWWIE